MTGDSVGPCGARFLDPGQRELVAETLDAAMLDNYVGHSLLLDGVVAAGDQDPLVYLGGTLLLIVDLVSILANERGLSRWQTWLWVRRFLVGNAELTS
jgi:hypothetical protein